MSTRPAGTPGRSRLEAQNRFCRFENRLDESVVQGRERRAIKPRSLGQSAACDIFSLGRQAHKLFPPICGVSDSPGVTAFFQTIEQQHQHILIEGKVPGDLFLSDWFRAASGQQHPYLTWAQAELPHCQFSNPLTNDERALGQLQEAGNCKRQLEFPFRRFWLWHLGSADISAHAP
jgi:hypothetical protein